MKKNVKIIVAGAIVIVIAAVITVYLTTRPGATNNPQTSSTKAQITPDMLASQTPAAAKETQNLINNVIADQGTSTIQTISVSVPSAKGATTTSVQEIKAVVVNPGTNPIDINSGKVITMTGAAVNNAAEASSPQAPQESVPVPTAALPKSTIKLQVTSNSFTPNTFTVNAGQAVSLAVTNANTTTFSEVFRFDDPSLSAVVVGLAKGETKSISFNAPTKTGEYVFYSDMFDHRAQGAVGKMIVK